MNSAVAVYEKLRPTVGEEGARVLVEYVDSKIEKTAVTKLDLEQVNNTLRAQIIEVEKRLEAKIADVENRLEAKIAGVESRLEAKITEVDNNLRALIAEVEKRLEARIITLEWKMKLYFLALGALIIITNPKIMDLLAKLLGIIK
ncbi:MAG: hypothetical protein QME81_14570 [bacterium]|nr:hypothetical protein [bacterium]